MPAKRSSTCQQLARMIYNDLYKSLPSSAKALLVFCKLAPCPKLIAAHDWHISIVSQVGPNVFANFETCKACVISRYGLNYWNNPSFCPVLSCSCTSPGWTRQLIFCQKLCSYGFNGCTVLWRNGLLETRCSFQQNSLAIPRYPKWIPSVPNAWWCWWWNPHASWLINPARPQTSKKHRSNMQQPTSATEPWLRNPY